MGGKPICVLGLFYRDLCSKIQVFVQSHISITCVFPPLKDDLLSRSAFRSAITVTWKNPPSKAICTNCCFFGINCRNAVFCGKYPGNIAQKLSILFVHVAIPRLKKRGAARPSSGRISFILSGEWESGPSEQTSPFPSEPWRCRRIFWRYAECFSPRSRGCPRPAW